MEIQKKSPRAERVVMISDYLKKLSEQETALHYPISSLLEKHVDGNDLIRGLIHNVVPFYRL